MRISFLVRALIIPAAVVVGILALGRAGSLPYGRAAQIALAFVLFADLATLFKGGVQNALVVLASLAFGVAIVEGVAEARLPRIVENEKGLWDRDPNLGHHAKKQGVIPAEKVVDGNLSYRVSYTIDPGLRRLTVSNPNGAKVRFFGDSYTFGEGLNDADTLPQSFADITGANVLNFGYPAYSPAQALRAVELGLYDKDLKDTKLLILQTGPYQIERIACLPWWTIGFPRYVEKDGKLAFSGQCAPAPRVESGAYRMLVEPKVRQITHADAETYIKVVEAFVKLAQSKYHAPVLILDMAFDSDRFQSAGFTQEQVEARFRSAGATVLNDDLDATSAERMIPYDGHPTGLANRLMARKTVAYLAKAMPDLGIKPPPGTAAARND